MKTNKTLLLTLIFSLVWIGVVQAAPIGNNYLFQNKKVIDFAEWSGAWIDTSGQPIQIGSPNGDDILWESSSYCAKIGDGAVRSPYSLGTNGEWSRRRDDYFGIESINGHVGVGMHDKDANMTFTFAKPLIAVGGLVNYDSNKTAHSNSLDDIIIAVLDKKGNIFQELVFEMYIPGSINGGYFRGFDISNESEYIYGFKLTGSMVCLDNLTYSYAPPAAPVPEPATMLLFGTGMVGLIGTRLRKRRYNHGK